MSIDQLEQRGGPGEVISEVAQGYRNVVKRGEMTPDEANKRTNEVMRALQLLELAGFADGTEIPFESGSTQIEALVSEGRRIRGEEIIITPPGRQVFA